ncbi:DUF3226 domain-containing protein [Nitrosomonas sp. Nm166]|uniref:DUF3226 domain-containing protein n=1 Tax=Nitrosomonas sp. Nm166 TaxID=1881054 RepID=UPI0008E85389|nr:DUF3226 domain-containing protein [Nitrosomonas sp. Nm166]SFF12905.1 hypothetical protein SAMN05428977_105326 [Nitrosomonas sp. Nm166]
MPIHVSNKKLLIVEGKSDKAFFRNLLQKRNIQGFDIFYPGDSDSNLEGEDAIKQFLDALPIIRNFNVIEKIIIVVDADNDSNKKFEKFKRILTETKEHPTGNERYPVPNCLNSLSTSKNGLSVAIVTLPYDESTGAMETLCWRAAMSKFSEFEDCINTFVDCAGVKSWSPQKRDKFKLRSYISIKCEKNPDIPVTNLWKHNPNIVPLESEVFNPLVNYLEKI